MRMPGELRFTSQGQEQVFLLEAPTTTIGRGGKNLLILPDQSVSRFHAELIRLGRDYLLRDIGSVNGTYVNGARVTEQLLNDGDAIRFGTSDVEFIFTLVSPGGDAVTQGRHVAGTTDNLIESLSTFYDPSVASAGEEVSRCCVLAEAYLSKGLYAKALDVLGKYSNPENLLQLPPASRTNALYWIGRARLEGKQYTAAREALSSALEGYLTAADDVGIAEAHAALGRALAGLGDWASARDSLHRALLGARKAGNVRLHAEVHLQVGKLDWKEGDFDGARYNWSRAARLSEDSNDPVLRAGVLLHQAFLLLAEGKLKEAVPAYQLAIEQAEKLGNVRLLLKAYSNQSRALTRLGSWAATERLLEYRLRLARDNALAKAEAVALTDLAELRYLQGNLNAAWNVIQTALQRHNGTVYARTQRILGRVLSALGDRAGAIREYEKGIDAAQKKGALEEQILLQVELSQVYLELGDREGASQRLRVVENDPMLDPGLVLTARALHARGLIHAAAGESAEANRAFAQSLSIFQSIGDPYRLALSHAAIGMLRIGMRRLESARAHLEEAKEVFAKLGARGELEQTERQLAVLMRTSIIPAMTEALPPGITLAAPLSMSTAMTSKLNTALLSQGPQRILIAEADEALASVLENGLVAENFVVDRVLDGRLALERAVSPNYPYDLLILDTLLEHRSGFDVCRDLRKSSLEVPLILLGNRQGVEDKIEALQSGADDYVSKKAMVFEELLAKVQALLN